MRHLVSLETSSGKEKLLFVYTHVTLHNVYTKRLCIGNSRDGVPNVAIAAASVQSLLNGGRNAADLARELRSDFNVVIIIVAIGDVDDDEYNEIVQMVGFPQDWLLQIIASYADLAHITALIQGLECTASGTCIY